MKTYKFPLETALRVRRAQEDLAKAELARANARVSEAVAMVDARMEHYGALPMAAGAGPTSAFLAGRFRQETAAAAIVAARVARVAALQDAEALRLVWSKKAQDVSVLERLDGRRRAEHAAEAARQEEIEVDNIIVGRFGRHEDTRL